MKKKFRLFLSIIIFSQIGYGNTDKDLENISFLSAKLLEENNSTVAPLAIYQILAVLAEIGSADVKNEIAGFFPQAINLENIAQLTTCFSKTNSTESSAIQGHLYTFFNKKLADPEALVSLNKLLPGEFFKPIEFDPAVDSVGKLNNQICLDHDGNIEGPLKESALFDTLGFLVGTLFVKASWQKALEENKMIFNGQYTTAGLHGELSIKYYIDNEKTVIHIPASNGIWLVLKMQQDGVSPITSEDLNAPVITGTVDLQIPKFALKHSIDILAKLKNYFPITFSDEGFNTLFAPKAQAVQTTQFQQENEIEVNKKGLRAKSVTSAKLVTRFSTKSQVKIEINKPFSFLLAHETTPLMYGNVYDLPAAAQTIFLNSLAMPSNPTGEAYFNLLSLLFKNVADTTPVFGKESSATCPLSALLAFNTLKKIYPENFARYLEEIGFSLELSSDYVERLISNNLISVSSQQMLTGNYKNFNDIYGRIMEVDDGIISDLKYCIENFGDLYFDDDFYRFSLLNGGNIDWVFDLSEESLEALSALKRIPMKERDNEESKKYISNLSEVLGEDFLKKICFLMSVDITKISKKEDLKKLIRVAYFVLKNKRVLLKMDDIAKEKILHLTSPSEQEILSSDFLCNLPYKTNAIHAPYAYVSLNPEIMHEYTDKSIKVKNTMKLVLPWIFQYENTKMHINGHEKEGIKANVNGFHSSDENGETWVIPALGGLAYIIRVHRYENDNLSKPIVSFDTLEKKQFSIAIPKHNIPNHVHEIALPFLGQILELTTETLFSHSIFKGSTSLSDEHNTAQVEITTPFLYAIAKEVAEPDGSFSYAILVTGFHNPAI